MCCSVRSFFLHPLSKSRFQSQPLTFPFALPRSNRGSFSSLHFLLFVSFSAFYLYRLVTFGLGVRELWEMKVFFEELLGVGEVSSSLFVAEGGGRRVEGRGSAELT